MHLCGSHINPHKGTRNACLPKRSLLLTRKLYTLHLERCFLLAESLPFSLQTPVLFCLSLRGYVLPTSCLSTMNSENERCGVWRLGGYGEGVCAGDRVQPDGKCGEDRKGQLCSLPLPLSLSDSLTAPSQGTFTGYYSSWWSFSPIRVSLDYRFMCIPDFGGPDTGMGPLHTDGLVLSLADTAQYWLEFWKHLFWTKDTGLPFCPQCSLSSVFCIPSNCLFSESLFC